MVIKPFFLVLILLLKGSDSDIGGESTAHWAFRKDPETKIKSALFYGTLSMAIPENSKEKLDRSGYVALRSKRLPMTMLHHPTHDLVFYRYFEITARGNKRLWMVFYTREYTLIARSIFKQILYILLFFGSIDCFSRILGNGKRSEYPFETL